jgi:hypothetical protein
MATIRRIEASDAPRVRELYRTMTRSRISEAGLNNLETLFRLGAVHEDVYTLVAEQDGELVGFVLAEVTRSPGLPGLAGRIDELWTLDNPLRRPLVEEAIRLLRKRGVKPVFHYEDAEEPDDEPWRMLGFVPDTVRYSLYD